MQNKTTYHDGNEKKNKCCLFGNFSKYKLSLYYEINFEICFDNSMKYSIFKILVVFFCLSKHFSCKIER